MHFPSSPSPAGTARFLVIILDRLWNIIMDHKPDIGFVDPHSKCNGGDDHLGIFIQEKILPLRSQLAIEPGMIGHSLNAIGNQHIGQFLGGFAVQCINDPALAFILNNKTNNILDRLVFFYLGLDLVIKIRAG